jgi:hypothetical protein
MPAAVVLVILVVTGRAQAPAVTAMLDAATQVVGAPGAVRVVEVAAPTDAEALRLESALSARASAQVAWSDAAQLHARVRLHGARTERWLERALDFSASDTPFERGRALGFTLASMLPESDPALRFDAPAPPAPTPEPPAPPGKTAVGLAAIATTGLGGPAAGYGGAATVETFVGQRFSLDAALAVRFGHLDVPAASLLVTSLGAGVAWWARPGVDAHALGLALRARALLLHHAVSHTRSGGEVERKSQLLPGLELALEATHGLGRGLELCASAGLEAALGTIDVTVVSISQEGGTATIPAVRGRGLAGLRFRF